MKKIGLMGCGKVADYGHIPAILEVKGLQLHAIFDPYEPSLKAFQEKFKIPHAFTDPDAFCKSGIEAVTITSRAPYHKDNVLAAARQKLPVICEKPLALVAADAAEMIRAMKQAGVTLYSAFCYRFSPSALKIRELVQSGAIGKVRSLRLIYIWNCHGKFVTDANGKKITQPRRDACMDEGGPLIDCGTHQIDLAHFWTGSPVVGFSGHGAWVDEFKAPDHIWLHMDHANGAHSTVEVSYSYFHTTKNKRYEFLYELIGSEGVIRYDREAASFTLENGSGKQTFEFHHEKDFTGMYEEFLRALDSGKSDLLTSAEDGMRVVEIAQQATDEAIRKRPK